ncbi:MazG nucleotide pyrophosphohydrolase domain-containing protein [Halanaerobium sp. ST460_2HS_T2]|uniref:MazG nucleotide pyrophosphohydrolase domain-containing protein n=1 Tax=Halanaerobium sp. ST460_2HS_T2 TaxID=2183914 RepID=UPI000DF25B01|nr:MazG nucleotide pyrophosphohydrolase domain-containing protein [Halanaerobium sp. ST460_2HS_T2]
MEEKLTLSYLQKYIKEKDFKPNLKHAYFLKLVEEVGELSEVLRKEKRMINSEIKGTIEEELYDVFYYVLALANVYEVDLEEAFILKEEVNDKKYKRVK